MKTNVSIQETKFIAWHSSRARTDASRDTRLSRTLNMQISRVIAERAIHHVIVMDGRSFGKSQ